MQCYQESDCLRGREKGKGPTCLPSCGFNLLWMVRANVLWRSVPSEFGFLLQMRRFCVHMGKGLYSGGSNCVQ